MLFSLSASHVHAQDEQDMELQNITVTVNTPGTLGYQILSQVEQLSEVGELTVIGHINRADMEIFGNLQNVTKLDLSQTDITFILGCAYLQNLKTVILPLTVVEVLPLTDYGGDYGYYEGGAFQHCTALTSINLPAAANIGPNAFYDCTALTSIDLPMATNIGSHAFYRCSTLANIDLPMVTNIEDYAFADCTALTSINLPTAAHIGIGAFSSCSVTSLSLPGATNIGNQAFQYCSSLTSIELPTATDIGRNAFYRCSELTSINLQAAKNIGSEAFRYCTALTRIDLPAYITAIGSSAFNGCEQLSDVYCHRAVPLTISDDVWEYSTNAATLHVPAFSVNAYKLSDWGAFNQIVPIDEQVETLPVSTAFTIVDGAGLSDNVEVTLEAGGHLNITTNSPLSFASFTLQRQMPFYDSDSEAQQQIPTLITSNNVSAETVSAELTIYSGRWYFFSLPFDVNVADISFPDDALWVIRRYSGEDRAQQNSNSWQDMVNGMTLNAHEGYIIQCAKRNQQADDYSRYQFTFTFTSVNNDNKNNIFSHTDIVKPLEKFNSEYAHNRSWNLIGNPFPCYFNTHDIQHNGVITVWNLQDYYWGRGNYYAYSLLDDNYVLKPNEAFFVQCPDNASSITFKASGRQHEFNADANANHVVRTSRSYSDERKVYNLTLSNGNYADKARIVINPAAKADYEISCDASKFLAAETTIPQIYIYDNNIKYAIDERPAGNGLIPLGVMFERADNFTISLDCRNNNGSVWLIDSKENSISDLTQEAYHFTSDRGEFTNRFTLYFGNDIDNVISTDLKATDNDNQDNKPQIYDVLGRRVHDMQNGIYIIMQNGKCGKVVKNK